MKFALFQWTVNKHCCCSERTAEWTGAVRISKSEAVALALACVHAAGKLWFSMSLYTMYTIYTIYKPQYLHYVHHNRSH